MDNFNSFGHSFFIILFGLDPNDPTSSIYMGYVDDLTNCPYDQFSIQTSSDFGMIFFNNHPIFFKNTINMKFKNRAMEDSNIILHFVYISSFWQLHLIIYVPLFAYLRYCLVIVVQVKSRSYIKM